jgi:hypothetical protein
MIAMQGGLEETVNLRPQGGRAASHAIEQALALKPDSPRPTRTSA